MTKSTYRFCFVVLCFITVANENSLVCGFGRRKRHQPEEKTLHVKSRPYFRPWQRYDDAASADETIYERPRGLLSSLTSVAQHGASMWSNHISEEASSKNERSKRRTKLSSMEQTSSLYVSQLYKRIQKSRQDQETLNIDKVTSSKDDEQDLSLEEDSHTQTSWPEHFFQDTLAYIAGGAAATSAFSAVVVGTIFATVVVTIGAITSAIFFENDDVGYYLDPAVEEEHIEQGGAVLLSQDCDLDDDLFEDFSPRRAFTKQDDTTLTLRTSVDDYTVQELKKCFAGKPLTEVIFSTQPTSLTCSINEDQHDLLLPYYESREYGDHDLPSFFHEDEAVPTSECDKQHDAKNDEVEQPKVIELIWHNGYFNAANDYYTAKTANKRPRRNRLRKTVADPSFDFEETEREGALLLSDTFRVTSSAFGLLADAVRFTGESTSAAIGGSSRLVGGAVKAGGWAVGSLGNAILSDKQCSVKKRHRTRKVAGASIKLLGDAIDNVAESLLLAGSATERIAFASAGVAEGTVRIVEDLASTLSDVFAREGRRGIVSNNPSVGNSPAVTADNLVRTIEPVVVQQGDNIDDNAYRELSTQYENADAEVLVEELTNFFHEVSSWASQNADYIMQDTAGVSSLAPLLFFVLASMYFASIMLLSGRSSVGDMVHRDAAHHHHKTTDPSGLGERKAIPEGITAVEDADTHSTLTIDSTMKQEPDVHVKGHQENVRAGRVVTFFIWTTMLPLKLVYMLSLRVYRVIFNKKTTLLVIHILGWLFICQMSQNRSAIIERKATLAGYNSAVENVGTSSLPGSSHIESAFWLNVIISRIWRVESSKSPEIGGLEPYLASSVSTIFASRLAESYSKPSGVAHVSLASFTFGTKPPIIRNIEIKSVDTAKMHFGLDVIMLLDDANLILGEYKLSHLFSSTLTIPTL
jgi:hypothetical protein